MLSRTCILLAAILAAGALSAQDLGRGRFLVAETQLLDPNFAHTVILLTDHGEDGAVGLIVNRKTDLEASRLMPGVEGLADRPTPVFIGGPVEPRRIQLLIRTDRQPGEAAPVLPGVWTTASRDQLETSIADPASRFRVYAGYAGWAPGQLENEVARGDWHILPAAEAGVFDANPETLWKRLIDRASMRFARLAVRYPGSPMRSAR